MRQKSCFFKSWFKTQPKKSFSLHLIESFKTQRESFLVITLGFNAFNFAWPSKLVHHVCCFCGSMWKHELFTEHPVISWLHPKPCASSATNSLQLAGAATTVAIVIAVSAAAANGNVCVDANANSDTFLPSQMIMPMLSLPDWTRLDWTRPDLALPSLN